MWMTGSLLVSAVSLSSLPPEIITVIKEEFGNGGIIKVSLEEGKGPFSGEKGIYGPSFSSNLLPTTYLKVEF